MLPTVEADDRLFTYQATGLLRRGDLVTMRGAGPDPAGTYIRRIVAVGGDRVAMRGGVPWVNGQPLWREVAEPYVYPGGECTVPRYREISADGLAYDIVEIVANGPFDDWVERKVPPGHLFVLGDNRDNVMDSRMKAVGFLPTATVTGRPWFIYWSWPPDRIGRSLVAASAHDQELPRSPGGEAAAKAPCLKAAKRIGV